MNIILTVIFGILAFILTLAAHDNTVLRLIINVLFIIFLIFSILDINRHSR